MHIYSVTNNTKDLNYYQHIYMRMNEPSHGPTLTTNPNKYMCKHLSEPNDDTQPNKIYIHMKISNPFIHDKYESSTNNEYES